MKMGYQLAFKIQAQDCILVNYQPACEMSKITRHDYMMAWVSLLTAGSYLAAELNDYFKEELGISLPEQDLLKQLAQASGEITMTELAHRVFLSRAGMTKMVDRMETEGLVRRKPSKADRRVISTVLTEQGRRVVRRSWKLLEPWVARNFRAHLSDKEVIELGGALKSLLEGRGVWEGLVEHLRGYPDRRKRPTLADKLRQKERI